MNEMRTPPRPNNLNAFWMPYTANRAYKATPRLLARAEGVFYYTDDNRDVLDGTAGLWCSNAGHGRREITEAIQRQAAVMDFAPTFQLGHPIAFQAAARLAEIFDFLHHGLVDATENIQANDDGTQVTLDFLDWQRIQAVQMLISRYLRLISEPQEPGDGSLA